jgi:putative flippase GtrA
MNQFLTFAVIGVFNTIIDLTIWKLALHVIGNRLDWLFDKYTYLNKYGFCHVISALLTFNFSYWANKTFTFGSDVRFGVGFSKFLAVSLVSMFLAAKLLSYFTRSQILKKYSDRIKYFKTRYPLFCKLATIGVFMFVNYYAQKYLVF